MSSGLFWEPLETKRRDLPDELRFILRKKGLPFYVNLENILYFEALRDVGVKGAQEVIDAHFANGELKIDESY
jgi:hypothetical protein